MTAIATPPAAVGCPADVGELASLLEGHGVDPGAFGVGEARTLGKFLAELADGEVTLRVDRAGRLIRDVHGVCVTVCCSHPVLGHRLILCEDRQVFSDGRVTRRNLDFSVGEKRRPGEAPEAAARRALAEELGLDGVAVRLSGVRDRTRASVGYPGLDSRFASHYYACDLPPSLYRDEYVERQPDKTSIFRWRAA